VCVTASYLPETLNTSQGTTDACDGRSDGAAAMVTGGVEGAGCGATVDASAAGSPTAGCCTSSISNLIQPLTCCTMPVELQNKCRVMTNYDNA